MTEGPVAKIRGINIVGAQAFPERELLGLFVLRTPGWLTWYTQHDRYSRERLPPTSRRCALLPEPRLPRLQPGIDAGPDHARPARHLHHRQHRGGRNYTVSDVSSPASCSCRAKSWRS